MASSFQWNPATLPALRMPQRQRLDLSPINEGLDALAKSNKEAKDLAIRKDAGARIASGDTRGAENALFQAGMLDQGLGLQNTVATQKRNAADDNAKAAQRAAGLAQMAANETDPARKQAAWKRALSIHPGMTQGIAEAGIDPNDIDSAAKYVIAEARGYLDPSDQEAKKLGLEKDRAQIGLYNAQAAAATNKGYEIKEVNGRLVRISPDGQAHEVYNAGPDTSKAPQGYKWSDDGAKLLPIPGGPGDKLTEGESKDALFAERMLRAESDLNGIIPMDEAGNFTKYNPTQTKNAFFPEGSAIANLFQSSEWQQYQRAARESLSAILRKDTGAAVTPAEFDIYFPTYFPQPGDSAAVVMQKKQAREAAAKGLRGASSRAFDRMFPDFDAREQQRQGQGSAMPSPRSSAEYQSLPAGTRYTAPDGSVRTKQ